METHTHPLKKALALTAGFMLIEALAGWFSNSLALLTDSAHMLTDVAALSMSLVAAWVSRLPQSPRKSFGYRRAEILGALVSGLATWVLAGILCVEAVSRLWSPPIVEGAIVFWVALVGMGVNFVSLRLLHRQCHENLNVRAAYLHVLGDLIGSLGAVLAGAALWFKGWAWADPVATLVVAGLVLLSSSRLVLESLGILMEFAPTGLDPARIRADLESIPEVKEVHDLHIWSVTSGKPALSVHLVAENADRALTYAAEILKKSHGIVHTTIQVEHPTRFRSEACYDCSR